MAGEWAKPGDRLSSAQAGGGQNGGASEKSVCSWVVSRVSRHQNVADSDTRREPVARSLRWSRATAPCCPEARARPVPPFPCQRRFYCSHHQPVFVDIIKTLIILFYACFSSALQLLSQIMVILLRAAMY